MKGSANYVVRGALFGALIGAIGGWVYVRYGKKEQLPASRGEGKSDLDLQRMVSLAGVVLRAVRQLMETA